MKMHLKQYETYQNSHNEWVEALPIKWHQKRVKDIFRLVTDMASANNNHELLSLYTSIGVRPRKDLEARGNKASSTDGYWLVKRGDIIVNKLLAWMGAIGLSNYDGVTSPAYDILRKLDSSIDENYFAYLFRTEKAQQIFKRYSRGIMDMRLRLYFDKFGSITVPVPPFNTQQTIATYLDTKTMQIDHKVDLLTKKATHYKNLKRSIINETVTNGLDKTVPMKNSGIERINVIPAHWSIKRVKEICSVNKKTLSDKTASDYKFEYVDIASVKYGEKDFKKQRMIYKTAPSRAKRIVEKGDTIISTVRTYLKAIAFIEEDVADLIASTGFAVITPRKRMVNKYCSYLFLSDSLIDEICALSTGVSYPAINASRIECLSLLIPPMEEQAAIVDYLDEKIIRIDSIIETITTQIEKLKELRKTLINDVVTGIIMVTKEGQAI